MKQRLLVSSIIMGLCAGFAVNSTFAQNADQPSADSAKKKEATELQGVIVTGSLIPRAQIETASPVLTITGDQMQKQGFGNVYDALRSLPLATGAVQDSQFQGGFTQGAKTISLLGLDPGFTLYLIDGHPLADYPLLYNGASNFVDLSNVPIGLVDHIDILPGNQSAIYGSSAIAGVINIILKQKMDGVDLSFRTGGFSDGGGQSQRLEMAGGNTFGKLDLVWGLQLSNQDPIWGFQRDYTSSTLQNPNPALRYGSRTFLYEYISSTGAIKYPALDPSACAPISNLFGNTTTYSTRPGRGNYCGSTQETGYGTISNQSRIANGYLKATYQVNDDVQLYGDILYSQQSQRYSDGRRFWTPNGTNGFFVNADTGRLELFQHIFAPEEAGGLGVGEIRELQRTYNAVAGVRGAFGSSNWNYNVYFDRSEYFDNSKELWPLRSKVDSFFEQQFLGPKLGTTSGYPIYSPNVSNFYKALTPAQYASFQGLIQSQSETWTQHINLQITNTDLFSLPAGSVGFAGILQAGEQSWDNPAQQALIDGDFWGRTGTSGSGKRKNYAIGGELSVPIFSTLTANLSARYDDYKNEGGASDNRTTYKLGLEYRPIETLLLRGNYASAFRAPDMAYSFGGASGFFTSGIDYYRCAKLEPTTPIDSCTYNNVSIFGDHTGNKNLKSITAKSFGYGIVWSPTSDFNIKADYYHIKISNEVSLQSIDQLLKDEAACRLGQLDINSPTCIATLAQINRTSGTAQIPYLLNSVTIYPINISNETVAGAIASISYKHDFGRYGDVLVGGSYNTTLKHEYQQYPGDPTQDLIRNPYYSTEFKNIANAYLTWDISSWSTTVFTTRYGKTPNYASTLTPTGWAAKGAAALPPWMIYNASVTYHFSSDASITLSANNIFNTMPARDSTDTAIPYYNFTNYNVYGRQVWAQLDVHFGGSGK